MGIVFLIQEVVAEEIKKLYSIELKPLEIQVSETKPEFEGDYTVLLFALTKQLKKSPEQIGKELGEKLAKRSELFSSFNVIKGFLNLSVADDQWLQFLTLHFANEDYGRKPDTGRKVVVEYSSPNTNKPLHLGHLRNNFLGWSISEIFRADGYDVKKTAIANDRGIHICKSMVAWKEFANGQTPESAGVKGDHLVGDYYVKFGAEHKKQVKELTEKGMKEDDAEKEAPIMKEAQQMLVDWEAGKEDVVNL